jgi:hypothetical protein
VKIRRLASDSSSPGSTKTVSERCSSRAAGNISRLGTASPSVKTANWLPASGAAVKTSTTV